MALYSLTLAALVKLSSKEGMLQNSSSFPSMIWVPEKRARAEQGAPPVAHWLTGASEVVPPSGDPIQLPLETHRPPEQQPSLHVLPAQQMSPRVPHLAQTPSVPLLVQAVPPLHWPAVLLAAQHASPALPHEVQVPLLHSRPS